MCSFLRTVTRVNFEAVLRLPLPLVGPPLSMGPEVEDVESLPRLARQARSPVARRVHRRGPFQCGDYARPAFF